MDIRDMTQAEFDALMHKIRVTAPNVYQMIVDYSEGNMTAADAERFKEFASRRVRNLYHKLSSEVLTWRQHLQSITHSA